MAYNIPVVSCRLVRDKAIKYASKRIMNAETVFELLREELGTRDRECFVVIACDTKLNIRNISYSSIGDDSSTSANPRCIFRTALLSGASEIIVVHNHPSGDCTPSNEDFSTTKTIANAGRILGINLLDHIIIGDAEFYSMKEHDKICNLT